MLRITNAESTINEIKRVINSDTPEFIGRIPGGLSLQAMYAYLNNTPFTVDQAQQMSALTGFFAPHDSFKESLYRYAELELSALRNSTLCIRNATDSEEVAQLLEFLVQGYVSTIHEWSSDATHTWVSLLEGKKVLVVSAFAETMKSQWENRKLLHTTNPIPALNFEFPNFEVSFVKSPLTVTGCEPFGYDSWHEAFDFLCSQVDREKDYDIALLSCGAYAVPLGGHILKQGKKSWVVGGILQTVFGIKGNRWSHQTSNIGLSYNDYWVDPSEDESPKYHPKVRPSWDNFWKV